MSLEGELGRVAPQGKKRGGDGQGDCHPQGRWVPHIEILLLTPSFALLTLPAFHPALLRVCEIYISLLSASLPPLAHLIIWTQLTDLLFETLVLFSMTPASPDCPSPHGPLLLMVQSLLNDGSLSSVLTTPVFFFIFILV